MVICDSGNSVFGGSRSSRIAFPECEATGRSEKTLGFARPSRPSFAPPPLTLYIFPFCIPVARYSQTSPPSLLFNALDKIKAQPLSPSSESEFVSRPDSQPDGIFYDNFRKTLCSVGEQHFYRRENKFFSGRMEMISIDGRWFAPRGRNLLGEVGKEVSVEGRIRGKANIGSSLWRWMPSA